MQQHRQKGGTTTTDGHSKRSARMQHSLIVCLSDLMQPPLLPATMQLRSRFAAHSAPLLLLCASLLCLFVPTHGGIFPPPTINGTNTNIKMRAYSQLQFVSITKIDGVEQAFNADFFMLSTWAAPKHDPAVTWQDDLVALSDFYWQPQLDFINAIGGVTPLITDPLPLSFAEAPLFNVSELWNYTLPDDYIWCTLDQRYVGSFLTPVDMSATHTEAHSERTERTHNAQPNEAASEISASGCLC